MRKKIHEYLARQYMLLSDYEIFYCSNANLTSISLHRHDFYECSLIISGDVTCLIEGKFYYLKPGDIILVNSKERHQIIIKNKEKECEVIVLCINRALLRELSTEETDLLLCFEGPNRKSILRGNFEPEKNIKMVLYKLMGLEYYEGIGRELLYKVYITEIMVYLNNLTINEAVHLDGDMKKNNLINEIIDYINGHIGDNLTIDKLSEYFFLSKYHLSREFKKCTGTTIHKYIVQKKLIEAKELIIKNTPIIEVYKQCGFGDYSNFFRAFKNEYGVTPKQFYGSMQSELIHMKLNEL